MLDADIGPNLGQNYPVLTRAEPIGSDLVLAGTLHSTPDSSFRIELFATSECDPSGHGEGERFVGSTGVLTDAEGNASFFAVANSVAVAAGEYLTATAIDRDGNTSEFSECLVINTPPEARCQDATVPADASCVAFASIDDGSFDPDGGVITRTQDPASPYMLGTTGVTLTVRDAFGAEDRCIATVTVVDETAPSIVCPADLTVPATSPAGAAVSFSPAATDNCSVASVVCAPAAGSTFAIGTTTTTCTATDGSRNPAACSFEVHVQGAAEQLADLIAETGSLGLNSGLENSLQTKLQSALEAIAAGDTGAACQRLQTFESEVGSLMSEGQLELLAGGALLAHSQRIRSVLGCR